MADPYAPFGGTLKDSATPLRLKFLRSAFKQTANRYQDWDLTQNQLPTGNIRFEFIDTYAFNAVAFLLNDREFVGINHGILHIYTLYSAMFFADHEVFSDIGNEEPRQSLAGQELLRDPTNFRLGHFEFEHPKDQVRNRLAAHLNLMAYDHLLNHELAHIVKCHIPLLAKAGGGSSYLELPAGPFSREQSRLRRVLELDADSGGFDLSLRRMEGYMRRGSIPGVTPDNYVELWAAAIMLLYRVMGIFELKHGMGGEFSTHPSVWSRIIFGIGFVSELSPTEEGAIRVRRSRVMDGMREVMRWWRKNELPLGEIEPINTDVYDELQDLWALGREIFPELLGLQAERKARVLGELNRKRSR